MLERGTTCIDSVTLRRLLPKALKAPLRTHHIRDQVLIRAESRPGIARLKSSPSTPAPPVAKAQSCGNDVSHATGMLCLDFLYPSGVFRDLVRQPNRVSQLGNHRHASQPGGLGRRKYSSLTTDTPKHIVEARQVVDELPVENTNQNKDTQQLFGGDTESSFNDLNDSKQNIGRLRAVIDAGPGQDFEEVWSRYTRLDKLVQSQFAKSVMGYLSTSSYVTDAERLKVMFAKLPPEQRNNDVYRMVILAHLRLEEFEQAMAINKIALLEFAQPSGCSELLAYLMGRSQWEEAFAVWCDFQNHRTRFPEETHGLMMTLSTMEDSSTYIRDLIDWYDFHSEGLDPRYKNFLGFLLRGTLLNPRVFREHDFDYFHDVLEWLDQSVVEFRQTLIVFLDQVAKAGFLIKYYRQYRERGDTPMTERTLLAILHTFCNQESHSGVQEVLDDYRHYFIWLPPHAYRATIKFFARQGDVTVVHTLFKQYVKRYRLQVMPGLEADDFAPILHLHTSRGEIGQVLKYLQEIKTVWNLQPTILCWNILLNAYAKSREFQRASRVFREILSSSLVPDDYTFGTMMAITAHRGDHQGTVQLWELSKTLNVRPSYAMVDCIVQTLVQDDLLDEAEALCEQAVKQDLKGSGTYMWNTMIVTCALRCDILNARRLLERMVDLGIKQDEMTYAAVMQVLAMTRQPGYAERVLDAMPAAGVRVTTFHYAVVMGTYLANHQAMKVLKLQSQMAQAGLSPSASTRLLWLKGAAKYARQDEDQEEDRLHRAIELFKAILASLDPKDLVSKQKGLGEMSLTTAYPSMLYQAMMRFMSAIGQTQATEEIFNEFQALLPHVADSSIPIMRALMANRIGYGTHEEIDALWERSVEQALWEGKTMSLHISHDEPHPAAHQSDDEASLGDQQTKARKLEVDQIMLEHLKTDQDNIDQPKFKQLGAEEDKEGLKVLTSHRFKLCRTFDYYIKHLSQHDDLARIVYTKDRLESLGFALDHGNWNEYISALARHGRGREAFELCERILMPGFFGWADARRTIPGFGMKSRVLKEFMFVQSPKRGSLRLPFPERSTCVQLGKFWLDLRILSMETKDGHALINHLRETCPSLVRAIETMSLRHDDNERAIMGASY